METRTVYSVGIILLCIIAVPYGIVTSLITSALLLHYPMSIKVGMVCVVVGCGRSHWVVRGLYKVTKYSIIPESIGVGVGFWIFANEVIPDKSVELGTVAAVSALIIACVGSYIGKSLIIEETP